MAKKTTPKGKKVKKPKAPQVMPDLIPPRPPVLLTGTCRCPGGSMTVRIPHHARVDMQMLTARCKTCNDTFYLTEKH